MAPKEKTYYTQREIAQLLQLSDCTVRVLRKSGVIPRGYVVSKNERWQKATIDDWMRTKGIPQ